MMWVYQKGITATYETNKFEHAWQVGFYDLSFVKAGETATGGEWKPIIAFPLDNEAGARQMVHFLNGGD